MYSRLPCYHHTEHGECLSVSLPTLALVYAGAASVAEWGGRDRALGWWKLLAATAATGAVNTLRPRLGGFCLRVVSLGLFPGSSTVFYRSARPCTLLVSNSWRVHNL